VRNVLVAVDGSEPSFRAVEYCARQFGGLSDLSITLLHVLPNLPPRFWDPGHILDSGEQEGRRQIVESWIEEQKAATEPMFQAALAVLTRYGIEPDRIRAKTVYDSTDVAGSIIEEVEKGQYLTLILGRKGSSRTGGFSMGSTTSRILNRGAKVAVSVVE
jgi:nucleotide-binding universal stress UspA family protein